MDAQFRIEGGLLRHIADLRQDASIGHFFAEDMSLAAAGLEQAAENFDSGGLARAVGTQQPVYSTVLDIQVQLVECGERPGFLGQVLCLDSKCIFHVRPPRKITWHSINRSW